MLALLIRDTNLPYLHPYLLHVLFFYGYAGGGHSHSHDHEDHAHAHDESHAHSLEDLSVGMSILCESTLHTYMKQSLQL
jgi:hypothetical protein